MTDQEIIDRLANVTPVNIIRDHRRLYIESDGLMNDRRLFVPVADADNAYFVDRAIMEFADAWAAGPSIHVTEQQ